MKKISDCRHYFTSVALGTLMAFSAATAVSLVGAPTVQAAPAVETSGEKVAATYPARPEIERRGHHHRPMHRNMRQRKYDPAKAAERIAADFGVERDVVLAAFDDGCDFRDVFHGAVVSKAAHRPLAFVLRQRAKADNWRDVEQALGVAPEDVRAVWNELMTKKLTERLGLPRATVADLVSQNYHPHDIAFAAMIAKMAKAPIGEVIGQKRINNSWRDVAQIYGVTDDQLHAALREAGAPGMGFMGMGGGFRRDGFDRHHHYAPDTPTSDVDDDDIIDR